MPISIIFPPIISLLILILGFFVFFSNPKIIVNRLFLFLSLCGFLWHLTNFLVDLFGNNLKLALLFSRLTVLGPIFLAPAMFWFSLNFPLKETINFLKKFLMLFFSLVFFFFSFTKWNVEKIWVEEGKVYFRPGIFYYFLFFYLGIYFSLTFYNFLKSWRKLTGNEKLQVEYLLFGFLFATISGLTTNLILPLFGYNQLLNIGPSLSLIIFLGFTAFAIVKKQLFGIRIVLTTFLVALISIFLLVYSLMTLPNWKEFARQFTFFLIFVYLGYLLIKSVIMEIKRREEIERIDRVKSEFISIVSHQLRTPLTAIKGYISMILEGTYGNIPEKMEKPLVHIYKSNERLIKLVNDILNLSKLETGKIEFEPGPTSLKELIAEVVEELKINAEKKNLYLQFAEIKEPLPEIMVDRNKLRQVILNIIDNAIKYTQEGGIAIKLEKTNDQVKIQISDTGEGMTKEEINNLFQMFSRATAGTQLHTEGAGLGLYVARRFIEIHGGKIWAESSGKGRGSTFFIQLPIKLSKKQLNGQMKKMTKQGSDIF